MLLFTAELAFCCLSQARSTPSMVEMLKQHSTPIPVRNGWGSCFLYQLQISIRSNRIRFGLPGQGEFFFKSAEVAGKRNHKSIVS